MVSFTGKKFDAYLNSIPKEFTLKNGVRAVWGGRLQKFVACTSDLPGRVELLIDDVPQPFPDEGPMIIWAQPALVWLPDKTVINSSVVRNRIIENGDSETSMLIQKSATDISAVAIWFCVNFLEKSYELTGSAESINSILQMELYL